MGDLKQVPAQDNQGYHTFANNYKTILTTLYSMVNGDGTTDKNLDMGMVKLY